MKIVDCKKKGAVIWIKKNSSIASIALAALVVVFLSCTSLTMTQDNSQTKNEYGSTVGISGPFTAQVNQSYNIILSASTDAPIYQWAFYEDGNFIAGSGFVWGQTLDKTYSFTKAEAGSHTYLLKFRGIMGAHGWPPYTEVSITVNIAPLDTTPPVITIISPEQCANYDWEQLVPVSYEATDPESGIKEVTSRIDISIVQNNTEVEASSLGYGNHILLVRAVNNAGLEATAYATFKANLSFAGMASIIDSYVAEGLIDNRGVGQSLKAKLPSPTDNPNAAVGKLNGFINELNTQSGQHIDPDVIPSLFLNAKSAIANTSPDMNELARTIPYILETDDAAITIYNGNQSIKIPLKDTKTNIQFNAPTATEPDIMTYNVLSFNVPPFTFQVGGQDVTFTAWQDQDNPSIGTINFAQCGLVTESLALLFSLTINEQTYGPYQLMANSIGVQHYADHISAICLYSAGHIPPEVPLIGGSDFEMCQVKQKETFENVWLDVNGTYTRQDSTCRCVWTVDVFARLTQDADTEQIIVTKITVTAEVWSGKLISNKPKSKLGPWPGDKWGRTATQTFEIVMEGTSDVATTTITATVTASNGKTKTERKEVSCKDAQPQ
ncbi:MAG: hypothetical protein AB1599_01355 [Planctomycetota bacterium]